MRIRNPALGIFLVLCRLSCPITNYVIKFYRVGILNKSLWRLCIPLSEGRPGRLAGVGPAATASGRSRPRQHRRLDSAHRMEHGRRNFKDTNPLMSSLLVIFVWGG